ncbi:MAG: DUF975 family protein [Lachnospiraceae bacterium]|nr:DUF975 family protein [Lachnospiraceae bacterium]
MWTRKELKAKGKESFQANYWKCVLVAMLLALVTAGSAGSFGGSGFRNRTQSSEDAQSADTSLSQDLGSLIAQNDPSADPEKISSQISDVMGHVGNAMESPAAKIAMGIAGITVLFIVLIAVCIGVVFDAFVMNPIELGCKRFFRRNLGEKAQVANVAYGFDADGHYKGIVKTLFQRDIFTFLWSLLFLIPGIIKAYEYRMMPYILAENPALDTAEVFARSKAMMKGQKWNAFVLDLSFLGWYILSVFTFGLLNLFFVSPYKKATNAALYEALKGEQNV